MSINAECKLPCSILEGFGISVQHIEAFASHELALQVGGAAVKGSWK